MIKKDYPVFNYYGSYGDGLIPEAEASKFGPIKIKFKGLKFYLVKWASAYKDEFYFEFLAFDEKGKNIKYLNYADYVINCADSLLNYYKRCKAGWENKIFYDSELKYIKDYNDYRNKLEFLNNIYYQLHEGESLFSSPDKNIYKFYGGMCAVFKNEADAIHNKRLLKELEFLYKKYILGDPIQFKKAVKYEFWNHETPIDWDGMTPALEALGLKWSNLTPEYKNICETALHEVRAEGNW